MADRHQILQSSLQCLNNDIAAADGSSFGAVSSSSSRRRRRQQDDASPPDLEASIRPLSQSILELADCQRQLILDQGEHRHHEEQLAMQRNESTRTEQARDRIFRRQAELSDMARKYRKLNAELDLNTDLDDARSRRLSEFYTRETSLIEEAMQQLLETSQINDGNDTL